MAGLLDIGQSLAEWDRFRRRAGRLLSDPAAEIAQRGLLTPSPEFGASKPQQHMGLLSAAPQEQEQAMRQALAMAPALLGAISPPVEVMARATGFPNGGYYAIKEGGEIIRDPAAKYGDMARRFNDPQKAIEWGEKILKKQAK